VAKLQALKVHLPVGLDRALPDLINRDDTLKAYWTAGSKTSVDLISTAEIDLAQLKVMKAQSIERIQRRNQLFTAFGMPLIVVGLTALAGNWIASSFQSREFRSNSLHQYRLETLKRARDDAVATYLASIQAKININTFEAFGGNFSWYLPIKSLGDQLEKTRTLSYGVANSSAIEPEYLKAKVSLQTYEECLKLQQAYTKSGETKSNCSSKFDESIFKVIAERYSEQLVKLHVEKDR
jgi:hypothetical protein